MTLRKLPPVKHPGSLPLTYALSLIQSPDRDRWWAVIVSEIRADQVVRRKIRETFESKQAALDECHRLCERLFYFNEGAELVD